MSVQARAHQAQEGRGHQQDGGAIVKDQGESALDGLEGNLPLPVVCRQAGRQTGTQEARTLRAR